MPKKSNIPQPSNPVSLQAIELLTHLGEALKRQQRHFDEAVVTHCVQLIHEYVQGSASEYRVHEPPAHYGGKNL
jgi:hypothetical protein